MSAPNISLADMQLARHPWHAVFFTMIALFVYAIFIFTLAGSLFPAVSAAARGEGENPLAVSWLMQSLVQVAIFAHMTYWAAAIGAGPFAAEVRMAPRWVTLAVLGGPIVQLVAFTVAFTLLSNGEDNWALRDDVSREAFSAAALGPMMILSLVVLAPLVEEVGFRGIALGCMLGRGIPAPVAIIVQAVGFALLHTQYTPAALFGVFVLGLFLGWLRYASKSIAPPILAHMAINLQAVGQIAAG